MFTLIRVLFLSVFCADEAIFRLFDYVGNDVRFTRAKAENQFYNPIMAGFYPDPSICRKGEDYYMVHSTFIYFPGLPVMHSKDLVHWEQIGNALDHESQLKLDNVKILSGLWAPAITYNEKRDEFYIFNTNVDSIGMFFVTSKDPSKGWSEPNLLNEETIDPSIFFDDDGKGYVVYRDDPQQVAYNNEKAIYVRELNLETKQYTGQRTLLVTGGVNVSAKPIAIEGPHIFKVNGTYYLMCAEGGTDAGHSEVIFTASSVLGPYTAANSTINPILTQRDLTNTSRTDIVTCAGHADIVQTPQGDWWAVFLATRPYSGETVFNTGRETFMLPVTWNNGFPIILPHATAVPTVVTMPSTWKANTEGLRVEDFSGNFNFRDDFSGKELSSRYVMVRTPHSKWWALDAQGLHITPSTGNLTSVGQPALVGFRQGHIVFNATTLLVYTPTATNTIAGISLFQSENHYVLFGKTLDSSGNAQLVVISNGQQTGTAVRLTSVDQQVYLRIAGDAGRASFYYSTDGSTWQAAASNVDVTGLASTRAMTFTGVVVGLYVGRK